MGPNVATAAAAAAVAAAAAAAAAATAVVLVVVVVVAKEEGLGAAPAIATDPNCCNESRYATIFIVSSTSHISQNFNAVSTVDFIHTLLCCRTNRKGYLHHRLV